jgi:transcriptional regulator with XRE-family HTH domain
MTTPEIDFDIFRENLKKARYIKDMTAKEVSFRAGLKQQKRVADIEEGRGKPTLEEVFSICVAVEQSIDSMLHKESEMKLEFK